MTKPKYMERCRKAQNFDKDNIFVKIKGEKINVYKMIQENREDTEIAKVLDKYGCIEKMGMDTKKTYNSLIEINDMRDIYEAKNKADQLWENLPIEVRQEFNNNAHEFMKNGKKWLENKIAKETPPVETIKQEIEQTNQKEKGE